jgi:hypothetical protein
MPYFIDEDVVKGAPKLLLHSFQSTHFSICGDYKIYSRAPHLAKEIDFLCGIAPLS